MMLLKIWHLSILTSKSITIKGTTFKSTSLSKISIKGSASVSIQGTAFRNCKSLETVYLERYNSVIVQESTFCFCSSLRYFTINGSRSVIVQDNAFCGCTSLIEDYTHISVSIVDFGKNKKKDSHNSRNRCWRGCCNCYRGRGGCCSH